MDLQSPANRSQSGPWLVIAALALLALGLTILAVLRLAQPNRNQLALGDEAAPSKIEIELQPPVEFDFKSRAEVLALREQAVQRHPELLQRSYRPSDAVFGLLVDGLPWWGMAGIFYYGSGEQSITGPSEEARFLLNPFLLVGADFYHHWVGFPESEILKPGVALDCPPTRLVWNPQERWGEATYSARCIRGTNGRQFDLIAYNARDFNLNYIYVPYAEARNVEKADPPSEPYAIPHYLHQGDSCGYPGGCNNMSPRSPKIDGLVITGFPAQMAVWLWEAQPASLTRPPDMVFLIRFD